MLSMRISVHTYHDWWTLSLPSSWCAFEEEYAWLDAIAAIFHRKLSKERKTDCNCLHNICLRAPQLNFGTLLIPRSP